MVTFLTGKEPLIAQICRAAFPGYNGKMFRLDTAEQLNCRSYWDEGSRDDFAFVRLSDMQATAPVPDQSPFNTPIPGIERVKLPDGVACVRHTISRGKDLGLTIFVNAATMNPTLLPAKAELCVDEQIVLAATATYKPSYNGISDYRFREAREYTGITRERWKAAKASCIARKLLNKAGAITTEGRNALGSTRLDRLRAEAV